MGDVVSKSIKLIEQNKIERIEFRDHGKKITGQDVVNVFQAMLDFNNTSVKTIDISVTKCITDEVAQSLAISLQQFKSSKLKRGKSSLAVRFGKCDVTSVGLTSILSCLPHCDCIGGLSLIGTYQPIDRSVVNVMRDSLSRNSSLLYLEIGGFAVNSEVTNDFVQVLHNQIYCSCISLHRWELKPKDLTTLLKDNRFLQWLDLSNCELGDEGAIALAQLLRNNMKLRAINLSSNSITNTGAKALLQTLQECETCSVCSVLLEKNEVDDPELLTQIAEAAAKKENMEELNVPGGTFLERRSTIASETEASADSKNLEELKSRIVNKLMQNDISRPNEKKK